MGIKSKVEKISALKDEYLADYKPIYIPEIVAVFESSESVELMERISLEIEDKKKA